MSKRVFVGIKINNQLHKDIEDWAERYRNLPVRWITKRNLHITLIPPWYEKSSGKVMELLKNFDFGLSSFEIKFYKASLGPKSKRPRLIWVKGRESKDLSLLKRSLEKILQKKREQRIFVPHITLARFKARDFERIKMKEITESISWKMKVDSFVFYESHLTSKGSEYRVLQEIRF